MPSKVRPYDKIVYLLQGGGALGSYQVGVCQALLEYGLAPNWVVGYSIGSINAAIIAGNKPKDRIKNLVKFWESIALPFPATPLLIDNLAIRKWINFTCAQYVSTFGLPGFFKPKLNNPWLEYPTTPDKLSYYDTNELKDTLLNFIDFDLINKKNVRLTLGVVNAETGNAERFDNFRNKIGPEHVMASCALPPGFPAIKINNQYYWDGGISSNTPFSEIIIEKIPQKLLCFIVDLYSYRKHIPHNMMEIMKAQKEIEYSSRHKKIIKYFCEIHSLQHAIQSIVDIKCIDKNVKRALNKIKQSGHPTALNIVQFHYLDKHSDLWSKDYNFSQLALKEHWENGYTETNKALAKPDWLNALSGPKELGIVINDFSPEGDEQTDSL